ncbi:MAG: hypothetical protein GX999_06875 [Bacteroidales bacterium]|jgi:hypothetical protein|nr:hypothetical protein [Bacteroidales bacterium]
MTDRAKQFVDELNDKFSNNLSKIETQFNDEYGWPEFDPLRDEIAKCLICDLCQAAITLTNHLLENFLKTMLIYQEAIQRNGNTKPMDLLTFRPSIDKFDGQALFKTLEQAKSKGLISNDQWELLDKYRNDFRNAYSHAEKKKIFKDKTVGTNLIKVENEHLNLSDSAQTLLINLPFGQGIAQVILSKEIAFDYFISVDNIIRDVLNRFGKNTVT